MVAGLKLLVPPFLIKISSSKPKVFSCIKFLPMIKNLLHAHFYQLSYSISFLQNIAYVF